MPLCPSAETLIPPLVHESIATAYLCRIHLPQPSRSLLRWTGLASEDVAVSAHQPCHLASHICTGSSKPRRTVSPRSSNGKPLSLARIRRGNIRTWGSLHRDHSTPAVKSQRESRACLWGVKTSSVSGERRVANQDRRNARRGAQTLCLESSWRDGWGSRIRCLCRSLRAVPTQGVSPTDTDGVSAPNKVCDINGDRICNILDVLSVAKATFKGFPPHPVFDVNKDGVINLWGPRISSVSVYVKRPPTRTRGGDHREPVSGCSPRPGPSAYHAEGRQPSFRDRRSVILTTQGRLSARLPQIGMEFWHPQVAVGSEVGVRVERERIVDQDLPCPV